MNIPQTENRYINTDTIGTGIKITAIEAATAIIIDKIVFIEKFFLEKEKKTHL